MPAAKFDLRRVAGSIRSRAKECYVSARTRDRLPIQLETPSFSFTFDDAPTSAFTLGATILEEFGCRGTFFLCGKFLESDTPGFITRSQAAELCRRGHTVGAHTYGHLGADQVTTAEYLRDVGRGMDVVATLNATNCAKTFSYPYGQITSSTASAISNLVDVARTTFPGTNSQSVNPMLVRGNRLYSTLFSKPHVAQLIQSGIKPHTWTVYYTHDVSHAPSRYGTTPDQLKWTIEQCLSRGGKIVPFAEPLSADAQPRNL